MTHQEVGHGARRPRARSRRRVERGQVSSLRESVLWQEAHEPAPHPCWSLDFRKRGEIWLTGRRSYDVAEGAKVLITILAVDHDALDTAWSWLAVRANLKGVD